MKNQKFTSLALLSILVCLGGLFSNFAYGFETQDDGLIQVKLNPIIHNPNMVIMQVDFINPQTNKIQEHIDYTIVVSKDGNNVFEATSLVHTSLGTVKIPVETPVNGNYDVLIEVEGILFQPVPVQRFSFQTNIINENLDSTETPSVTLSDSSTDSIEVPLRLVQKMATSSTGHMLFSGVTSNSIVTVDPAGNVLQDYSSFIDKDRSSTGPYGMAFDSNDNLYFADTGGTIFKYDSQGNLIWKKSFLHKDDVGVSFETGWIMGIVDAVVDSSDNLVVVGTGDKIVKIDPDGTMILKFGLDCYTVDGVAEECLFDVEGSPQDQVRYPGGYFSDLVEVEVDSAGNIYALDRGTNKIQKLDSQGNFLKFFERAAPSFYMPYHITMDHQDFLYASDRNENEIYQFNSDGEFLQKFIVPYDVLSLVNDHVGSVYYVHGYNCESSCVVKLIDSDLVSESTDSSYNDPRVAESVEIQTPQIPSWVKTNAGWWGDNQIDDNTFVSGIQFMIKENLIDIPNLPSTSTPSSEDIPDWVRNNAKWWADGTINDSDFLNGIQYLVSNGIVVIDDSGAIKVEEIVEEYPDFDEDYVYPIGENEENDTDYYTENTNSELLDNNKSEEQPVSDFSTSRGTMNISEQVIKLPNDPEYHELMVYGNLNGASDFAEVNLMIYYEQDQTLFSIPTATFDDGYFEVRLAIDPWWDIGSYTIIAEHQSTEFARATLQVIE